MSHKQVTNECDYCGKPTKMRANQRFCSSQCRSGFANDKLRHTITALIKENESLKKEITMLRGEQICE